LNLNSCQSLIRKLASAVDFDRLIQHHDRLLQLILPRHDVQRPLHQQGRILRVLLQRDPVILLGLLKVLLLAQDLRKQIERLRNVRVELQQPLQLLRLVAQLLRLVNDRARIFALTGRLDVHGELGIELAELEEGLLQLGDLVPTIYLNTPVLNENSHK